jgi:hypothetical protein
MYLHPHIHTELIRQQQHDLARRTLHAPLSSDLSSRSRRGKATAVKIGALLTAALATLALTTGAHAASAKTEPHHGKLHKGTITATAQTRAPWVFGGGAHKGTITATAQTRASWVFGGGAVMDSFTAHNGTSKGSIRVVPPRITYIHVPGPAQPPVSSTDTSNDDCVNYQLNCTNEQNCQYWGVCDQTTTTTSNDAQTANQDNSASDASTNSEAGPADSTLADAAASSDSAATQSTDIAANLSDPSQNDEQDC